MAEQLVLFETEAGFVLLKGHEVVLAVRRSGVPDQDVAKIAERARTEGAEAVGFAGDAKTGELERLGLRVVPLSESERDELNAQRAAIMVRAGFAADEQEALEIVRARALEAAEARISVESSREDLQLVHGIQALDEMDRFVNIASERVAEWYSLHFPELQAIVGDNMALSRLVSENGSRTGFTEESLMGKGFSEKKVEAIVVAGGSSKGGSMSERDLNRVVGLSKLVISLASEREKLAEYVESTMSRIAPNTTAVAGATIGARLMARAGGLERLARLPASTIQVLGAEKALFRALRTGARPPKHGVLFQHEAVHSAPKWQRGKIARALANKIAIAARIDYYRGSREDALTGTLEKRLEEIKVKYKEPREVVAPKRSHGDDKRPRRGKGWKGRGPHKEPRPRYEDLRRGTRQDRGD